MSTFRQKVQATTDWGKPDPEDEAPVRGTKAAWRAAKTDRVGANGSKGPKRRAAQSPVTSHRLFPAMAALWFAALFGLGSLAISSAVLGKLVMAMGLPALVPAAAPPLGLTAHILVAFALAVVGAAFGLVLGLRLRPKAAHAPSVAKAAPFPAPMAAEDERAGIQTDVPKVRARDAHPDAPPRRPLVLTEAFADPVEPLAEELVAPAAPAGHRSQGLAAWGIAETVPEAWIPVYTPGGAGAQEPLDLAALDFAELDAETPHGAPDVFAPDFAGRPDAGEDLSGEPLYDAAAPETSAEPVPEMPEVEAEIEAEIEAGIEAETGAAADLPRPVLLAATPQLPRGFTLPFPGADQLAVGEPWSPVAGAPLESLGLVQLIERLALAIAARKAAGDAGPPPAADSASPETDTAESGILSGDGAESLVPEGSGPAGESFGSEVPEGLLAARAEADLAPDVPPAEPFAPFAKPAGPVQAAAGEPVLSARDAILRRLGAVPAPVQVEPVQVEPAPGAGPGPFSRPQQVSAASASGASASGAAPAAVSASRANPEASPETNEALRSALATLQRMSARG